MDGEKAEKYLENLLMGIFQLDLAQQKCDHNVL
jgi:hypothetical protein